MLNHILVTLDGSGLSEKSIDYAREIVAPGGTVTLLRVVDMPDEYEDAIAGKTEDIPADEASYDALADRARLYLKRKTDAFREKELKTEILIESGDPAQVIVMKANDMKVDAIVMCTHGRTGIQRWIHGSVTQAVMRQMPCPVVVVPGYSR
jgi:nucleotide-binding universal stress UspA family protein